ncbi:MAG: alpha/beta hydrolase [Pseudomonadota bacterium]
MQHTSEVDGIDMHIEGEGAETIVMVHGWPDTYRLWDDQVAALRTRYRCVRFTLPGFDIGRPSRPSSLDEIAALLLKIVRQTSPEGKVILMLHDWGCVFGYEFYMRHPELVSRIVGVDIGDVSAPDFSASLSVSAKLMTVTYQVWLALAFRIGGRCGDAMARAMAKGLKCETDPRGIRAQMGYPYYITWFGAYGSYRKALRFAPTCPMLYIYGTRKPFMFHSPRWAAQLEARPECKVLAMRTGHWVMRRQPREFNDAVLGWLNAGPAAVPVPVADPVRESAREIVAGGRL